MQDYNFVAVFAPGIIVVVVVWCVDVEDTELRVIYIYSLFVSAALLIAIVLTASLPPTEYFTTMIKQCKDSGANLVICQWYLHPFFNICPSSFEDIPPP